MNSLETLNTRLQYHGGHTEGRLERDKLRTLKRALFNSYQAETAVLEDGREFKCLINRNKLTNDYNDQIISIPYKDICLNKPRVGKTTQGIEEIGMKTGDVFQWKENGTYWLVFLEYLNEDAYFRAQIKKCEEEIKIKDKTYHLYVRGPVETTIDWRLKENTNWNDLNYTLIIYVTKDADTLDFFHRFQTLKIQNQTWEVWTVDPYSADGIIEVVLGEYYNNSIADAGAQMKQPLPEPALPEGVIINGNRTVRPYDIVTYTINIDGGEWSLETKKAKIRKQDSNSVTIEITTGRSGEFNLYYQKDGEEKITYPIKILSI